MKPKKHCIALLLLLPLALMLAACAASRGGDPLVAGADVNATNDSG